MDNPSPSPPPRRQFSLSNMMLLMFLLSVCGAVFAGIFRGASEGEINPWFVLAAVIAPIALVMGLSAWSTMRRLWLQFRRREK